MIATKVMNAMSTMNLDGIALVARQEFRTRLRTGRWKFLLVAWFVVVGGFTVLLRLGLSITDTEDPGIPLFGTLLLFVLILTLLVAPALTAQSINGDRERGTLATLQVTRLSPWEITLGKFVAAWATGLATLVLTLPFIAWPIVEGDVSPLRGVVSTVIVALLIGAVCAVSQAISALVARSITSALLSYLTVFALMVGTVIAFFIAMPLTQERVDHGDYTETVEHTENIWWLLAPNPFVILADASPRLPLVRECYQVTDLGRQHCYWDSPDVFDPLGEIGRAVRKARVAETREDGIYFSGSPASSTNPDDREPGAVWPYGLGFTVVLAAASLWITARRLETPTKNPSRGVRIA